MVVIRAVGEAHPDKQGIPFLNGVLLLKESQELFSFLERQVQHRKDHWSGIPKASKEVHRNASDVEQHRIKYEKG